MDELVIVDDKSIGYRYLGSHIQVCLNQSSDMQKWITIFIVFRNWACALMLQYLGLLVKKVDVSSHSSLYFYFLCCACLRVVKGAMARSSWDLLMSL